MKEKKIIEKLRRELRNLINKSGMNDSKVIAKSQKLDELMLKYQKKNLMKKKK